MSNLKSKNEETVGWYGEEPCNIDSRVGLLLWPI